MIAFYRIFALGYKSARFLLLFRYVAALDSLDISEIVLYIF